MTIVELTRAAELRLQRRTEALIEVANTWSETGREELLEELERWAQEEFGDGVIPRERFDDYIAQARALIEKRRARP